MTTALIVVDVQNDFADPKGNLYVEGGDTVAYDLAFFIDACKARGHAVVYTKDWHPADTSHFTEHGGPWPKHCVAETWGSEFHPDMGASENVTTIFKGIDPGEDGYSGFYGEVDGERVETALHDVLQTMGVTNLTIVGLALDVCVKATALDAVELGYNTAVFRDYTAAVTARGAEEALLELHEAGVTLL